MTNLHPDTIRIIQAIDILPLRAKEELWDWIYEHALVGGMIIENGNGKEAK